LFTELRVKVLGKFSVDPATQSAGPDVFVFSGRISWETLAEKKMGHEISRGPEVENWNSFLSGG
jgi:hypothetical protein